MNYNFEFPVTGGTTRSNQSTKDLQISPGRIVHLDLYFPAACANVTHIQIDHHGSQKFPANPDGDYCAENQVIDFPDLVDIVNPPHILKIHGWKTTAGDVTVYVNVTVIPIIALKE